ncbi:MAG: response regulator transcription factor [Sphingobacteriales bacterium]|nr:MAG: response regulator transcription factor [Sphingobacteriales bacterium]
MSAIKVGVVEDEVIIADNIISVLSDLGYITCEPAGNYGEALSMLGSEQPDIVLLDINLARSKDGIEVAKHIRSSRNIPVIFLTANSDRATVERAKQVNPNAFLVKPFHESELYSAIEVAIHNFSQQQAVAAAQSSAANKSYKEFTFIKEGQYFNKVNFSDILYLSSDHVYVTVHTTTKKYLVRTTMQEYIERLDPTKFIRAHRSYVINMDRVEKINSAYVLINGEQVPMSKNYREEIMQMLNL